MRLPAPRNFAFLFLIATVAATGPGFAETVPGESLQSPTKLADEARASIREIPAAELSALQLGKSDLLLVDVRTEREYLAGHLRNAEWIPRGKLEFAIGSMEIPADRQIVLYCRTGSRAALAARALQDMGYSNVYSLAGGFKQWVVDGNSVFNQHGEIRVLEFEAIEK